MITKLLSYGSCKLFKLSDDKNEYKRLKRTLSKGNKLGHLKEDLVNDVLMGEAIKKLSDCKEIYILHDPSDIRKPHSTKLEKLGKVRNLNNEIINGYSSYNMVAITPYDKTVHLLSHELYSNKDPKFLKAEYVNKIKEDKDFSEKEDVLELYNSQDWFNKKTLAQSAIKKVSNAFKDKHPDIKITHILDREFDDDDYFNLITGLNNNFIIRAKKTRSDENQRYKKKIKINNQPFRE